MRKKSASTTITASSIQRVEAELRAIIIDICPLTSQLEGEEQKDLLYFLGELLGYWFSINNTMRSGDTVKRDHLLQIELECSMAFYDCAPNYQDKKINGIVSQAVGRFRDCNEMLMKILGIDGQQ